MKNNQQPINAPTSEPEQPLSTQKPQKKEHDPLAIENALLLGGTTKEALYFNPRHSLLFLHDLAIDHKIPLQLLTRRAFNTDWKTTHKHSSWANLKIFIDLINNPEFKFNNEPFYAPPIKTLIERTLHDDYALIALDSALLSLIFHNIAFNQFQQHHHPLVQNTSFKWNWDDFGRLEIKQALNNLHLFCQSFFLSLYANHLLLENAKDNDWYSFHLQNWNNDWSQMIFGNIKGDDLHFWEKVQTNFIGFAINQAFKNVYNTVDWNQFLPLINQISQQNFQDHAWPDTQYSPSLQKALLQYQRQGAKVQNETQKPFTFNKLANHQYFVPLLQKNFQINAKQWQVNPLMPLLEATLNAKWFKKLISHNLYAQQALKKVLVQMNDFCNQIENGFHTIQGGGIYLVGQEQLNLKTINHHLATFLTTTEGQDQVQTLLNQLLLINLSETMNQIRIELPRGLNAIIDYQKNLEVDFQNSLKNKNNLLLMASTLAPQLFLEPTAFARWQSDSENVNHHQELQTELTNLMQRQKSSTTFFISQNKLIRQLLNNNFGILSDNINQILHIFKEFVQQEVPFLKPKINFLNLTNDEIEQTKNRILPIVDRFLNQADDNENRNIDQLLKNLEFLLINVLFSKKTFKDEDLRFEIAKIFDNREYALSREERWLDFDLFKQIIELTQNHYQSTKTTLVPGFAKMPRITIIENGETVKYFPVNATPYAFLIPYLFNNCAGSRLQNAFQRAIYNNNFAERMWYLGYNFNTEQITTLSELEINAKNLVCREELGLFNRHYGGKATFERLAKRSAQPNIDQFNYYWQNENEFAIIKEPSQPAKILSQQLYEVFQQKYPAFSTQKLLSQAQIDDLKALLAQEEIRYNQMLINRYQTRTASANEPEIAVNQPNQEFENNI